MRKFDHFASNLEVLLRADREDLENEFITSGIIDKFFLEFELGWKVLKELLRYEGADVSGSGSPRSIIKGAYAVFDFVDEEIWLSMLKARNDMAHIYDSGAAKRMVHVILKDYVPAFLRMRDGILKYYGGAVPEECV